VRTKKLSLSIEIVESRRASNLTIVSSTNNRVVDEVEMEPQEQKDSPAWEEVGDTTILYGVDENDEPAHTLRRMPRATSPVTQSLNIAFEFGGLVTSSDTLCGVWL
jgi:hypothetical protein